MPDLGQLLKSAVPEPPRVLSLDDIAPRVPGPRRWVAPLLAAAAVVAIAVPIGVLNLQDEPKRPVAGLPTSAPVVPPAGAATEQQRLDAARARWAASGIDDYRWSYRFEGCECLHYTATYEVRDGKPGSPIELTAGATPAARTVPELFGFIQQTIDRKPDALSVGYDAATGRVLSINVDPIRRAIDDEHTITVTTFDLAPVRNDDQSRLDAARARWAAAGIDDYTWTFRKTCFCPTGFVTVTVKDGRAGQPVLDDKAVSAGLSAERVDVRTVEDLFGMVQQAIDATPAKLTVQYDAVSGRVQRLAVDPLANAIDDEWGYEVSAFTTPGGTVR